MRDERPSSASSRSVTGPLWPTEPSSVDTRASRSRLAPAACGASRNPRMPRRRCASCQMASGAVPTPPPTSSGRRPSRGGGSRSRTAPRATARRPRAARPAASCPGPTASSMNSSRPSPAAHHAERARQERTLVLPRPSARPRPACRTGRDRAPARPGRRRRGCRRRRRGGSRRPPRAGARAGRACASYADPAVGWSSCSECTAGSPTRAEAIARAAAIPPAIVVMQGRRGRRPRGGSRSRPNARRCRSAC